MVSLVDVAPTLLDAAGLPPLPDGDGMSLWPNAAQREPLPARTVIAEGTLFGPERKVALRWPFKLELGPGDRRALYHLDDDPREMTDLSGSVDLSPWRDHLVHELEGRPEGFVQNGKLTPVGGPTPGFMPGFEANRA